jgi:hypothetical protein
LKVNQEKTMHTTAGPVDVKGEPLIPPEKKAILVGAIMGLRTILSDPDEARAKAAAEKLIDYVVTEIEKGD